MFVQHTHGVQCPPYPAYPHHTHKDYHMVWHSTSYDTRMGQKKIRVLKSKYMKPTMILPLDSIDLK